MVNIMNFKMWGIIFVLFSGVITTVEVKKKYDKRIESLRLFLNDFDFFINQISFLKTSVNEIILLLLKEKQKEYYNFYKSILEYLDCGDIRKAKDGIKKNQLYLNIKDQELIINFFEKLGALDYENELNNLKMQRETLKSILEEAKETKKTSQKSKCTLTMCLFFLVIIFFV